MLKTQAPTKTQVPTAGVQQRRLTKHVRNNFLHVYYIIDLQVDPTGKQQQEAADNLKAKQAKQAARARRKQEEPEIEDDVADDGDGDPVSDGYRRQSNVSHHIYHNCIFFTTSQFMLRVVQAKTNTIKENALIRRDNCVPLSEVTDLNEHIHGSRVSISLLYYCLIIEILA